MIRQEVIKKNNKAWENNGDVLICLKFIAHTEARVD